MGTVAEQFIGVTQAGVERIYGWWATALNPVVDAIRRIDGIEWAHVRNEEAGAFAAAAEAQVAGRPAVRVGGRGACARHAREVMRPAARTPVPAFATSGPYLLDVVTDPDVLFMPPHITRRQVQGFALAASKIVLTGGLGRMIDMARPPLDIPRP